MIKFKEYDKVILSVSGGKDSQAMVEVMVAEAISQEAQDKLLLAYADTGAEWKESRMQCQEMEAFYGIPLRIIEAYRPLPEHIERRGMWPSMACRYCTSDCKRAAVDKAVREHTGNILVVTGERREESRKRALLEETGPLSRLSTKDRIVTSFRPMLGFTEQDVWRIIGASGLRHHPAYDYGNERVSCALCVLASENDLRIGAEHHPDLAERYLRMEKKIGHTFRSGKRLKDTLK